MAALNIIEHVKNFNSYPIKSKISAVWAFTHKKIHKLQGALVPQSLCGRL